MWNGTVWIIKHYCVFNMTHKKNIRIFFLSSSGPWGSFHCTGFGVQRVLLYPQRFLRLLASLFLIDLHQQYEYDQQCEDGDNYKNHYPYNWFAFWLSDGFKISYKKQDKKTKTKKHVTIVHINLIFSCWYLLREVLITYLLHGQQRPFFLICPLQPSSSHKTEMGATPLPHKNTDHGLQDGALRS